jgi:hypothetical protein
LALNDFQKRLLLIVGVLAAVATVDAVFANPQALTTAHHGGQQLSSLQGADHH